MKKFFLACLFTGIATTMSAQQNLSYNQQSGWTYYDGMSRSDMYFTPLNKTWLRHNFFIDVPGGNRIIIQVADQQLFQQLMNIDSLIKKTDTVLKELRDSLPAELNNVCIELANDLSGFTRIRTRVYERPQKHFVLKDNELAALKIEQDTIIISGMVRKKEAVKTGYRGIYNVQPYKITILLNNYSELSSLLNQQLGSILEQIRSEWNSNEKWSYERNWRYTLYGYYNTADPSKNQRLRNIWSKNRYRSSVAPAVQVSMQAINGRFSPAVGAGIEYVTAVNNTDNHFQLFWEPYFYFQQLPSGKNSLYRNDFISFQYFTTNYDNKDRTKILFSQNFSFGYLAGRKGNFLEKNTFKFGLPGARYRDVFLHPEFVFHDLLKDFQPSIKLMLYLD